MSYLIFFGLIIATIVIAMNTIDNIKEMLTPQPVPVK